MIDLISYIFNICNKFYCKNLTITLQYLKFYLKIMKKIVFLARFICKKIDYINRSKNLWIKDLDIRDTLCTPRYAITSLCECILIVARSRMILREDPQERCIGVSWRFVWRRSRAFVTARDDSRAFNFHVRSFYRQFTLLWYTQTHMVEHIIIVVNDNEA